MTTWTELFSGAKSLGRFWYTSKTLGAATVYNGVKVPVGAKCGIISAVGAGGWRESAPTSVPGGGAAFARTKLTDLVAEELFNVQVGSPYWTGDAGTIQGDSIITRVTGNTVVCKAARGTGIILNNGTVVNGGTPGKAIDSIGDIKRDGKPGNSINNIFIGGESGGDKDDEYSLGFGGRGARMGRFPGAGWGGGGIANIVYDPAGSNTRFFAGAGRVCVEWFTKDPGFF